jgi:hypothetical protein
VTHFLIGMNAIGSREIVGVLLDFTCDPFPNNHEYNWVKRNCRRDVIHEILNTTLINVMELQTSHRINSRGISI